MVEPKSKADQDKMGIALQKLAEEDPTFRVETNVETGETVISAYLWKPVLFFCFLFIDFLNF